MDGLKVELEMKKNDLKSLEEALDEIELFDEEEDIPFLIGEVFLSHKLSRTQVSFLGSKEVMQYESSVNVFFSSRNFCMKPKNKPPRKLPV